MLIALIVIHLNFEKPFILYMDTLGKGIRAILYQKDDQGKECIIAYVNRALN